MYHLPLLPGYGPSANIRSSAAPIPLKPDPIAPMSEAEDIISLPSTPSMPLTISDEALMSPPPPVDHNAEPFSPTIPETPSLDQHPVHEQEEEEGETRFAEAVFFTYGVVVFFGLEEGQERAILEDIQNAGIMRRPMEEDRWEIEECHYAVCSLSVSF